MITKVCVFCDEEKSIEDFYKNSSNVDGLFGDCILCLKAKRSGTCKNCGAKTSSKKYVQCKPCGGIATRGANHYLWKGGRHINQDGYVRLTGFYDHPFANTDDKIFEHILIMSEHLGRKLLPGENVHHKNGNRADNTLSNLELWTTSQPAGQRVEDKVAWAIEMLKLYRPETVINA